MTMPSEACYRELIANLRLSKESYDAATDDLRRLFRIFIALWAVVDFLENDPEVVRGMLTRPLGALASALRNALNGAVDPLLDHAPPDGKKPSGKTRELVQGQMAYALEYLIKHGMKKDGAARWLAHQAKLLGVRCEDGAFPTAQQFKSCRSDIRRKRAPDKAMEKFDQLLQSTQRGSELKKLQPKAVAWAMLQDISESWPRSAPRSRTRQLKAKTLRS